jgi:hypothetical protein
LVRLRAHFPACKVFGELFIRVAHDHRDALIGKIAESTRSTLADPMFVRRIDRRHPAQHIRLNSCVVCADQVPVPMMLMIWRSATSLLISSQIQGSPLNGMCGVDAYARNCGSKSGAQ